ncbi:MAG: hypothetical protein IJ467_04200 [Bacteroidaceae bacterium]|nr:hypothetical protein [Bacteroidaceae bacterium]
MNEVISLKCPNCNSGVDSSMSECPACDKPIIFRHMSQTAAMPMPLVNKYLGSYRSLESQNPNNKTINTAIGICFLKLKMYDKALAAFEKSMPDNFDNAEPFYLAAVALLQGKKAFLAPRLAIDKMEEYLNAASMIEMRPVFYYFMAYIKKDYFDRKFLNTTPSYQELMEQAVGYGLTTSDIEEFHLLINQPL